MDITEICMECRNFFAPAAKRSNLGYIHTGEFTISNNTIAPLDFIRAGQYFRIVGSAMNDGVYCKTPESLATLTNETFDGAVWEMSVPRAFLKLCADIQAWRDKNEATDSANMSPFNSESFAGYSYTKSGSGGSANGTSVTWQNQFSSRLNSWKRVYVL